MHSPDLVTKTGTALELHWIDKLPTKPVNQFYVFCHISNLWIRSAPNTPFLKLDALLENKLVYILYGISQSGAVAASLGSVNQGSIMSEHLQ